MEWNEECCMDRNDFKSLQTSLFSEIDDAHAYMEYLLSIRIRIGIFTEIIPYMKENSIIV